MDDVSKMKVADLKRELKTRNLSTIGNKTELMERLQSAIDGVSDELSGVEGDELLDESVLTDEEEENILGEDDEILKSPKALKINVGETKTDEDELLLLSPNATAAPKKVVLKRKNSFKDIEETVLKENAQPATEAKVLKMSERNPITASEPTETKVSASEAKTGSKLSQLSEKERLEMRAKKFGQTATTAPVVETTSTTGNTKASGNANVSSEQLEKLKKRAERFGVVSPTIAKLDESEKLLKRKERFGANSSATSTTGATDDVWAEKARLRLERFKANEPITVTEKK